MAIVSHHHPFVVGVDTHAKNNVLTVMVARTAEVLDQASFPNSDAGCRRAMDWAGRRTDGDLETLWVIEGAATYGARLTRTVTGQGYQAVEAPRMNTRSRAGEGKNDTLDSQRIAQAVLPREIDHLTQLRLGEGERAAIQVLLTARDRMSSTRTVATNALTALLRSHDLGIELRSKLSTKQITTITAWRTRDEDIALATARSEAVRLARDAKRLAAELKDNEKQIEQLVKASRGAALLKECGFGPINAAVCLAAWSHPGRVRDDAAFAALAGTNPIPASSGNTTRHRLNRYGDRRLNSALHMAAVTRATHDPETKAYVERRQAENKTTKEIRRCIKRYLARKVFRILNHAAPTS